MPILLIKDMRHGQQADGGIRSDVDASQSFRRLVNYDVVFGGESARLRVRKGYERYNDGALPGKAAQVHAFVDMQQESSIIARVDTVNKWFQVRETGSHATISNYTATGRQPVVQFGDRLFLGTDGVHADDPGMIWTSHASIVGSPHAYRLGIKPPETAPIVGSVAAIGNNNAPDSAHYIDNTTEYQFAIRYQVGATDEVIDSVWISTSLTTIGLTFTGSYYIRCETDNATEPSGTLVDDAALSNSLDVKDFGLSSYKRFQFQDKITLPAGTLVWFVIQGDDNYHDHFNDTVPGANFRGNIDTSLATVYGVSMYYDNVAGSWLFLGVEIVWYIGGLLPSKAYEYKWTYLNSTHDIESRPSIGQRSEIDAIKRFHVSGLFASPDPQVDKVRIYRRQMDDIEDVEDDITDEWKFVAEVDEGAAYLDSFGTENLGAFLQTEDHYCLDEHADKGEDGREEDIVVKSACFWKGRIWACVSGSNRLYFSKVFESDGATGLIGTSSPDFFPLSNSIEIPEPAEPVDLHPLSNDQMVVYMSNETTYVIYGGDQPLNPPADFSIVAVAQTHGLIGQAAFAPMGSKHWIMTRDGIFSLEGMGIVKQAYESEFNASIIAAVENQYLDDTRMMAFGNELWALLDLDNDGDLDTVLILNMEHEILERGLYDRHWKMYQYNTSLLDICMLNTGDEFRQIFAGDAESNYVLQLNTGTLDNGNGITAYFTSHDLTARDVAMIYEIEMDAYYPDESAIPDYDWLLTDNVGNTASGTMTGITSADDVRGHRSGVRLKRPVSVRVRVSQLSTKADEIRAVLISHTGE